MKLLCLDGKTRRFVLRTESGVDRMRYSDLKDSDYMCHGDPESRSSDDIYWVDRRSGRHYKSVSLLGNRRNTPPEILVTRLELIVEGEASEESQS